MSEFFEWCIGIGLFFIGIHVAWTIFCLLFVMVIGIVWWISSLFEKDEK